MLHELSTQGKFPRVQLCCVTGTGQGNAEPTIPRGKLEQSCKGKEMLLHQALDEALIIATYTPWRRLEFPQIRLQSAHVDQQDRITKFNDCTVNVTEHNNN